MKRFGVDFHHIEGHAVERCQWLGLIKILRSMGPAWIALVLCGLILHRGPP